MRQSFIRCFLPVAALLLPLVLFGQTLTFQKIIGDANNESAYDVIETIGGYLLAGETTDALSGTSAALLVEIDKNGAIHWQKSYPQFNEGGFRNVVRANDGGYLVWGSIFTPDDQRSDAVLAKVDAIGNLVWQHTIGEPGFGNAPIGRIVPVSDGYLLTGSKTQPGYFQTFVLRVDNQGQTIWSRFIPAPDYGAMRASYLVDSLLYLTGTVDGLGTCRTMDIHSGAMMGYQEYQADHVNWLADMQPGPGDSRIMGGQINRDVPGQIRVDAWLQKTDAAGAVEWARSYKKGYFNLFESLITRPDGSSVAALNYINESPDDLEFNSMLVATDAGGNLLWASDFGNNNVHGRLTKIIQTADGGLLAVGLLRDHNNTPVHADIHVVKMDAQGELQSCCRVSPDLVVNDVPVELKLTGINESSYELTVPLLFAGSENTDLPQADFCNGEQPVASGTLLFCPGETVSIGGNTYTQPGVVTVYLPSATGGCDTLASYTLQYASENQLSNLQLQCPADITATIPAGQNTLTINYDLPLAGSDCVCPNLPLNLVSGPAGGSAFGPGTYTVCYRAQDDCGSEKTCCFNISVDEDKACDAKTAACLQFELRSVNTDADQNRVYRIRVTNLCDPALQYVYIQVPDGVQADSPDGGSVYTAPGGNNYTVKNPNFSPFTSIRFQPAGTGLAGGASDVFRYVLPPQTAPQYIHVAARLNNGVLYEAYLNTFFCPVGTEQSRPADERGAAQTGELQLSPNPASPGDTWTLRGMEVPEGALLLYDASGRLVLRSAIADNRILTNMIDGATGLWYFRVFSEGHFAGSGKVLIGN